MPKDNQVPLSADLPQQTTPAPKEEDFHMNVNDNPRANENVYNEDMAKEDTATDVGSEITDGEAS